MKIKLNGKTCEPAEGTTLERFMQEADIPLQGVAVAIAYEVIPKGQWGETVLEDGMELMIIRAFSGG